MLRWMTLTCQCILGSFIRYINLSTEFKATELFIKSIALSNKSIRISLYKGQSHIKCISFSKTFSFKFFKQYLHTRSDNGTGGLVKRPVSMLSPF